MPASPHFAEAPPRLRFLHLKTIHVSEVIAQGGRDGKVEAPGGDFAVELDTKEQPESLTPEHLFGSAYAACFLGSLKSHAEKAHIKLDEGATVTARTHLEEDNRGGYVLNVELRAALPGLNETNAQHLMNLAHQTCPYSKATRGNINVSLGFD